ncbi:carbohydrate ABC transporter permease [Paractinoplanes brasiliensis]|uniref:Carbohydrate ABC transporter membrane protein 1 (CUT1 family) n=1 Tax=Paractinoplanes brasiliensis TaxID=52695 RepID=A0A4R6JP49_9ACTN|nr:sugar ABC transporter permease [Actinoplanes brasiliensis]TDO37151.1 carbohydrate ABC transporter membrane protein 1 (CUT1 family) [Actinoplanes brasiliensis]
MTERQAPPAPGRGASPQRPARKDGLAAFAFLSPSIVTFVIFVLAPAAGVLYLSFYDWNLLSDGTFVGLANFERLFTDERLLRVYGSTVYMALAILAVNVVLGLLLAVLLETRMPRWLRGVFRLSFLFPFVISAAAVALIWRFLLNKDLGLVNYLLGTLGVDRIDWLGSSVWAPISIIIVNSWKTIGFSILVYIAGLQAIPHQLKEAAIVDGANAWTRFWRVTFPLLSPTIFFLVVINTINSFQIFAEPRVLTQGGPGDASRTIVEYLYDRAFGDFDLGYASAIGITFMLVLIVLTAIQFRFSRRWTFYE